MDVFMQGYKKKKQRIIYFRRFSSASPPPMNFSHFLVSNAVYVGVWSVRAGDVIGVVREHQNEVDVKSKMADSDKANLQEQIKTQGEVVRKLKAEKADKDKVCMDKDLVHILIRNMLYTDMYFWCKLVCFARAYVFT